MLKKCTGCGIPKPLDDFDKKSSAKDGRRSKCKKCRKGARVERKEKKHKKYKSPYTTSFSVNMSNELLAQIDEFVKRNQIRSRSEFFAHASRLYMSKALLCGMCDEVIGGKHYCGDCLLSYARKQNESR